MHLEARVKPTLWSGVTKPRRFLLRVFEQHSCVRVGAELKRSSRVEFRTLSVELILRFVDEIHLFVRGVPSRGWLPCGRRKFLPGLTRRVLFPRVRLILAWLLLTHLWFRPLWLRCRG